MRSRYKKKMKKNFIIITLIIVLLPILLYRSCQHDVKVRPITIKVIDAKSKKPIKNALVYYRLESYLYLGPMFLIIPFPNDRDLIYHTEVLKEYHTDENGIVNIEIGTLRLFKRRHLHIEEIAINLDIDNYKIDFTIDESIEEIRRKDKKINFFDYFNSLDYINVNYFYNPIPNYKGFYIQSTIWPMDPELYGGTKRQKFNILWNGNGLKKKKEYIIVELENY